MSWIITGTEKLDPDAQAYIGRVEQADQANLEPAVKDAINAFVVGCKADGIWNAVKASCILSGARTLNGALQPLTGPAPTPYNFIGIGTDYDRKTGLVGDGSTKYLDSGYAFPTSLQDNCHMSGFFSSIGTKGVSVGCYGDNSANGSYLDVASIRFYQSSAVTFFPSNTTATGFRGVSRSSSASFVHRSAGTNETANISSLAVTHQSQGIFARRRETGAYDSFGDRRLAFYSIGEALDLALLDARVTTLINAYAAAIP